MLLKHMLIIEPVFVTGEQKEVGEGAKLSKKSRAQIGIRSIEAERFTYEFKKESTVFTFDAAAKTKRVLGDVVNILYYPKKTPEGISIKETVSSAPKEKRPKNNKSNKGFNNKGNNNNKKNWQKNNSDKGGKYKGNKQNK